MKIFNTLTRTKEEFVPINEGKVGIYVCGPTVYDYIHIGNARPMIVFDTLRRYLTYKGYEVNYVSNFTDVDDKIIKRANEEGVDSKVISERQYSPERMSIIRKQIRSTAYLHLTMFRHRVFRYSSIRSRFHMMNVWIS